MLCATKTGVFSLALKHDLELEGLKDILTIPRDIKDMIVGNWWLDVGFLQV
jgi:hypothetical protein